MSVLGIALPGQDSGTPQTLCVGITCQWMPCLGILPQKHYQKSQQQLAVQ